MRLLILAAMLAALASASTVLAQTKVGTTFGTFLLIEPSARVAAMGNAGVTIPDGLDAVYYNPAAIATLARPALHGTHVAWLAGIDFNHVVGGMPLGRWGNGFASVTALNSGEIDVRTVEQPLGTGERYSVSDVALTLGYGRSITDRFAMGVQVSYVQETIWHSSTSTALLGFGTLYKVAERGLSIGASLSNFGTQTRYSGRDLRVTFDDDPSRNGDNGALPASQFTDPFSVPVLFRVGLGLPVRFAEEYELRLALDAFHPSDNTESVSAGAELVYRRRVALRWGYQNAFLEDSEVGMTMGAGLDTQAGAQRIRVDYGWAYHGRLGSVNRFSLGWMF